MKKFKSFLKLLGLAALIVLAMCGVGFFGALFQHRREGVDKPVTIERKEEDSQNEASAPAQE